MINTKLKSLIAKQLGMLPESITDSAELVKDLGADSLDLLEIVMSIEHAFGIKINDCEYAVATRVDKIVELIQTKINT